MAESKAEKMERMRREAEERAQKLQAEKQGIVENIDNNDPVDELTEAAKKAEEQPETPAEPEKTDDVSAPKYTFTEMDAELYATNNAVVRNLPVSKGSDKLGTLGAGEVITVTGQCNETGWFRIKYNDGEAYVSKTSLISNKPETKEEKTEQKKEVVKKSDDNDSLTIEFSFSRTRRKEKKDRRTMVLITSSTKDAVDKLLEEKYHESFNELVNELLDRWVAAHDNL